MNNIDLNFRISEFIVQEVRENKPGCGAQRYAGEEKLSRKKGYGGTVRIFREDGSDMVRFEWQEEEDRKLLGNITRSEDLDSPCGGCLYGETEHLDEERFIRITFYVDRPSFPIPPSLLWMN